MSLQTKQLKSYFIHAATVDDGKFWKPLVNSQNSHASTGIRTLTDLCLAGRSNAELPKLGGERNKHLSLYWNCMSKHRHFNGIFISHACMFVNLKKFCDFSLLCRRLAYSFLPRWLCSARGETFDRIPVYLQCNSSGQSAALAKFPPDRWVEYCILFLVTIPVQL